MSVLDSLCCSIVVFFFFQAEDGIRDLVRSRGLGDVYKRQRFPPEHSSHQSGEEQSRPGGLALAGQISRVVLALSLIHI